MLTPELRDSIVNNINHNDVANIFYQQKNKFVKLTSHTACHAGITNASIKNGDLVGFGIPGYNTNKAAQHYLEWLFSLNSVYAPVIKYSKDAFNVIRNPDTNEVCGFTLPTELNIKAAINFAKATRICGEHKDRLPFWKEFGCNEKLDPKITFLLMSFFRPNGDKSSLDHGSTIDVYDGSNTRVNLKRFLDNTHSDWDLSKDKITNKSIGYGGESRFMWSDGGNFLMYNMFPKYDVQNYTPLKTRFLIKYEQKRNSSFTKLDLENFYRVAERYV